MSKLEMNDVLLSKEILQARRGAKWAFHGPDYLPAWVADMDFKVAPAVFTAFERVIAESDFGYAIRGGQLIGSALAEAFAQRMKEHFSWQIDPAAVLPLSELLQGIYDTVLAFTEPGDSVIVQGPSYDPFREAIEETGRVLVTNHMFKGEDRWELDLETLADQADEAKLLFLCHPQNPTGRVFDEEELRAIGKIAIENDLIVISDEIWADLMFDGRKHIPFATLSQEIAERTVTLYSAGKSFNLAGLRGAVIHFGSSELQKTFEAVLPPRSLGQMNTMGGEATLAVWNSGGEWLATVKDVLHKNRDMVAERLESWGPLVQGFTPESTYLYWLDFSGLDCGDEGPTSFFKSQAKVVLQGGETFGPRYSQFARLNFATSPEILEEILDKMTGAILEAGARQPER